MADAVPGVCHSGSASQVAALDRDLAAVAARADRGTGSTVTDREYLVLTARRSG